MPKNSTETGKMPNADGAPMAADAPQPDAPETPLPLRALGNAPVKPGPPLPPDARSRTDAAERSLPAEQGWPALTLAATPGAPAASRLESLADGNAAPRATITPVAAPNPTAQGPATDAIAAYALETRPEPVVLDRAPAPAAPDMPQAGRAAQVVQQLAPAMKVFPGGIAEVSLSPDELGRVRMAMRREGDAIVVHITTDRPETQDLLQRHTPQLGAALREAGFTDVHYAFAQGGRQNPQEQRGNSAPQPAPADSQDPPPPDAAPHQQGDRLDLRL